MATDGSRCMGGSLEEQSLRYHWTVSDEGKRRRKGKKGIVVNKKGVHGDAISETREASGGRGLV